MHTDHSHDCSVPVADLLDYAEAQGLGAIAITDHNVFSEAQEAAGARSRPQAPRHPGEEIKTRGRGDRALLEERSSAALPMADTIAAIREQGGVVYLPHPFDRLHTIPDAPTLHRHLSEIDVFEVYNARLLFEGFNDEALRFARKYNLTMAAGSDAHVLQGVGTGLVACGRSRTPPSSSSASLGRDRAPAEVARLPAGPQVGGAVAGPPLEGRRVGRGRPARIRLQPLARAHGRHLTALPREGDRRDQRSRPRDRP
jgi:hypothetical protein